MTQKINRAAAQKELNEIKDRVKELEKIMSTDRGEIKDWLKTFEDACDDQGINVNDFYKKCEGLTDDEIAYRELKIIIKAANGNWEADYDNERQPKWAPYFDMRSKSGFGFSGTLCDDWDASTNVGSRLCFETEEKAKYIAIQFLPVYKRFLCK